MIINGWKIYQHKLFQIELDQLINIVEKIKQKEPTKYTQHHKVKLLTRILELITKEIPENPAHEKFNLGNTLGIENRFWKRAKFGRYRLFFRYDSKSKSIIYVWINNEKTLRKAGDKHDPYALFIQGLKRGKPPSSIEQLLNQSEEIS